MADYRERLLFIDDSPSQLRLYQSQMEDLYDVALAATYEEAMASLTAHQPDLIIVDMVMPQVDGMEFLDILKGTHSFARIPVIMVSGESDPNVVRQAFLKGASDFVRKPYDEEELKLRIKRIMEQPQRVPSPQEAAALQFVSARSLMIKALADLAGTRDNETGFHLTRIEKYTGILALSLAKKKIYTKFMSGNFLETIGEISVLHDIGKVGIPDSILRKPGPLTPEEYNVMKTHTTIGAETLKRVQEGFPEYSFLDMAHDVALHHHERWDGKGYPTGLAGEAIPLSARIVSLVDVFDALTTQRVYKASIPIDQAVEIMRKDRGAAFDPLLFDTFLDILADFRTVHAKLGESAH